MFFGLAVKIIFWLLAMVHLCLSIASLVFLQLRRKIEPVKSRSPLVLSTLVPPICFTGVSICLARVYENYSCKLVILQDFMYNALMLVLVLIRCGFTIVKFRIAHESFTLIQGKIKSSDSNLSLLTSKAAVRTERLVWSKYRKWVRGKRLVVIAWAVLLVLLIPAFIFMAILEDTPPDCPESSMYNALLYLYRICIVVSGSLGVFHMRREILDYFWLYKELKYAFILGCVTFLVFAITTTSSISTFNSTVFPISSLFAVLYFSSALILSDLYPCYLSNQEKKYNASVIQVSTKSLRDVISMKTGEYEFVEFLKREFALENWLFKQEVDLFRNLASQLPSTHGEEFVQAKVVLKDQACGVIADYIDEGGVHQVNISGPQQVAIKKAIQSWDQLDNEEIRCLFDRAADEVFELMEMGPYRRFVRSPQFKRLISRVRTQSMQAEALKTAGFAVIEANSSGSL